MKCDFLAGRPPRQGCVRTGAAGCLPGFAAIGIHRPQSPIPGAVGRKDNVFLAVFIAPPIRPAVVGIAGRQIGQPGTIQIDGIYIEIAIAIAGKDQLIARRRKCRIQILPGVVGDIDHALVRNRHQINLGIAIPVRHKSDLTPIRRQRRGIIRRRIGSKAHHAPGLQRKQIYIEPARRLPVGTERQPPAAIPRRLLIHGGVVSDIYRTFTIAPHHIDFAIAVPVSLESNPPAHRIIRQVHRAGRRSRNRRKFRRRRRGWRGPGDGRRRRRRYAADPGVIRRLPIRRRTGNARFLADIAGYAILIADSAVKKRVYIQIRIRFVIPAAVKDDFRRRRPKGWRPVGFAVDG